ncbi:MAG: hypothetical protein JW889_14405 [Verrucomicrobia bacterium]|nr:hypothetical protein [Verrucomicrobiota bacterium]
MAGHVIGIDGGGTKSVGVLADEAGRVVARATGGAANYHTIGVDALRRTLSDLTGRLTAGAALAVENVSWFCFALAGVWRETDRQTVSAALEPLAILDRTTLVSDVESVIAAAEPAYAAKPKHADRSPVSSNQHEALPVAVIAGTGSIVVGRDGAGRLHKVGGSGHLLDDDGSAWDLGISGLRAVIEAADGRGPQTALTRPLLDAAGLRGVDEIIPWLYALDEPKPTVARLAPVVIEAAGAGDGAAKIIVEYGASELARWAAVAAQRIGASGEALAVVASGGLFEHNELYRRLFEGRVKLELPHARFVTPQHEPAYGAALLALRDWRDRSRSA